MLVCYLDNHFFFLLDFIFFYNGETDRKQMFIDILGSIAICVYYFGNLYFDFKLQLFYEDYILSFA